MLLGNTANELIDIVACADVDTAGWFIDNQQLWRCLQAFGDQYFLLITARQGAGRLFRVAEFDIQRPAITFKRGVVTQWMGPEPSVIVGQSTDVPG